VTTRRLISSLLITACLLATAASAEAQPGGQIDIARSRVAHDYLLSCAGCHRFDGSGAKDVPSLYETGRLAALPGGREYLASVPGAAQAPLDDERLAAVLTWILTEFGDAQDIAPYGADEVAALRSRPLRAPRAERLRITNGRP
jgi:mono/diheme cytochrome c family protein